MDRRLSTLMKKVIRANGHLLGRACVRRNKAKWNGKERNGADTLFMCFEGSINLLLNNPHEVRYMVEREEEE